MAGDFLMLVTAGIAIGAWLASAVSLLVERRVARRAAWSGPWASVPSVAPDRYVRIGGLVGGVAGLLLALADAWLLR